MPEASQQTAPPPEMASPDRYDEAKRLVVSHNKASTSWLQRQLRVGYNTASALIERMECEGVVSAPDHVGRRSVLDDAGISSPAGKLHTIRARVIPYASNGTAQISIPIDLPEAHRPVDERLLLLIERIERLEEEKKGVGDDIKDVYNEVKATGYDGKVTRQIVRLRKMKPDDRREMEAVLETYKTALGMA